MIALILAAALTFDYPATVVSVTDGDTVRVTVAGWPEPFNPIGVRMAGIDSPEHQKPPARCAAEVKRGLRAKVYAATIVHPGDAVILHWKASERDKYGRLLGRMSLPDGSDFAQRMITAGLARPYNGGAKSSWCPPRKPKPIPPIQP